MLKSKFILNGLAAVGIMSGGTAFGAEAYGGMMFEPGITYQMANTSVDYPSPLSNSTGRLNGFGVSAMLGVHLYDVFFAGLQGRYGLADFSDSSTNYSASSNSYQWAPIVGFQTPVVGLRVWAAYILGGDLDPAASGNVDVKFSGANGYRLGVGYRVSIVSLNLEYEHLRYGNATLQQAGPFTPGTSFSSVHQNTDAWIASVSFPLEL